MSKINQHNFDELVHDKFCIAPWVSVYVETLGRYAPCCVYNHGTDTEPNTIGNIYDSPLSEIIKSDKLNDLKDKMLNNESVSACSACHSTDGKRYFTKDSYNTKYYKNHSNLLKTNETKFIEWDIRVSNLCNFKCRMCSPLWSTAWLDEWKKLYPNEDMFNKLITIEDSNSFWDELENHLPYVEHVYIAGGEPFLIKKNYQLIEKLSKINKDIVIRYNTNLSNLSIKEKNILTLLKDFNHIEFGLSIDGIGNVGEYIRTGLDTTKWESNLNELLSFKSDRDDKFITSINFDYTFNVMNYLHSFEFVTWITNRVLLNWQDVNGVDTANIQIKANPLHGPEYYNVQWLPMSIKNEFKLRMDEYLTKNKNKLNNTTFESVYVFLNTIYDFSMVGEYDIDLNNEFIKFTNKLDDIRNEDYTKVLDAVLIDKITL